jgi:hypothetical protein
VDDPARVIEALAVLAAVVLSGIVAWLLPLVSAESLVIAGWLLTTLGLALGLPCGVVYHVVLRSCLRANDALPRRWWVRPAAWHGRLSASQRVRVMRWFYLGGAGFVASVVGCAVVLSGVVLQGVRAGVF